MVTRQEESRFGWYITGCQFSLILIPTYLVTIFWSLLDGAFALLLLGTAALILGRILDIFKEVELVRLLLEIAHNAILVSLILWLCGVIWHLQSIYDNKR